MGKGPLSAASVLFVVIKAILLILKYVQAYNNIRDQVVVPTSVDSRRGEERDHFTRLVYPTNINNNQSSNRHDTSLPSGRHLQPPFLSPPPTNFQLNPSRALRRTEVTTYRSCNLFLVIEIASLNHGC
jgi:hypothetical protein